MCKIICRLFILCVGQILNKKIKSFLKTLSSIYRARNAVKVFESDASFWSLKTGCRIKPPSQALKIKSSFILIQLALVKWLMWILFE